MAAFLRPQDVSRRKRESSGIPQPRGPTSDRTTTKSTTIDRSFDRNTAMNSSTRLLESTTDQRFEIRKHVQPRTVATHLPSPSTTSSSISHRPSKDPSTATTHRLRRVQPFNSQQSATKNASPERGIGNLSIRIPQGRSAREPPTTSRQASTAPAQSRQVYSVSPSQGTRNRDIPEDLRSVFQTPTPLSEQSATPSLRNDSASTFSPTSITTPTSLDDYSPKVSQSPHFGPGYSTFSPASKRFDAGDQQQPRPSPGTRAFHDYQQQQQKSSHNVMPDWKTKIPRDFSASPAECISSSQVPKPRGAMTTATSKTSDARKKGPFYSAAIVRPPELAHLETATAPSPVTSSSRPRRPSRDGMEDLTGITALPTSMSPTTKQIQKSYSDHHARQIDSGETARSTRVDETAGLRGQLSRQKSSKPATQRYLPIRPPAIPALIDATVSPPSGVTQSRSTTSPSPATSTKSRSPFGLFHRKAKTTSPVTDVSSAMPAKKGPSAGTGHEGYGKYAGKRHSNGSSSTKRVSNGSASSTGGDDFLARKAAPVYLRKDSEGYIAQSDRSSGGFPGSRGSEVSSTWSSVTSQSSTQPSILAHQTYSPLTSETSISILPQDDDDRRGARSRRRGSSVVGGASRPRKLSKEPNRKQVSEESSRSVSRLPTPAPNAGKDIPEKTKKSSLRGIFGWGSGSSKQASKPAKTSTTTSMPSKPSFSVQISLADSRLPATQKKVAHYEIMDRPTDEQRDQTNDEMGEIGDIMEEAVITDTESQATTRSTAQVYTPWHPPTKEPRRKKSTVESEEVGLTLSPELQRQHSPRERSEDSTFGINDPEPSFQSGQATVNSGSAKNTSNPRTFPAQSFSRPFAGTKSRVNAPQVSQGPQPKPTAQTHATQEGKRSSSESSSLRQARRSQHRVSSLSNEGSQRNHGPTIWPASGYIPMRKNSDLSVSSSSGSFWYPTSAETAIIPKPGSPSSPDEVWTEYDRLIDEVMTPDDAHGDLSSGPGPLRTDRTTNGLPEAKHQDEAKFKTKTTFPKLGDIAASLRPPLSPFMGTEKRSPYFSILDHPALRDSLPPDSSNLAEASSAINTTNLTRRTSARGKTPVKPRKAHGTFPSIEDAALDVSKWMTFDQVLISPAHEELEAIHEENILVVDGLGKDWSMFCAKHYPKSQVFGLSPAPYETTPTQNVSPLPNYRHKKHDDLMVSFPFPQHMFHTVVLRFPVVTSDFSIGQAISECKRVLRPGGYLELCVLDLDLTVMGDKARRAITVLKTRLMETQPDVLLHPTSDHVQNLLGRHGFENLNRGLLGPPVAGPISSSPNNSRDDTPHTRSSISGQQGDTQKNDRLRIMAPKVARWWYTQVYEQRIIESKGGKSIWDDPGLLKECKDKGARFKLLVCYAQNPVPNKRKTQSL